MSETPIVWEETARPGALVNAGQRLVTLRKEV
jgi:hypothetical protein